MKYFNIKILIIIITLTFGMTEVFADESTDLGNQESSFYEKHKLAIVNTINIIVGCFILYVMYQNFKASGSQENITNYNPEIGFPCTYLSSFTKDFDSVIFPTSNHFLAEVAQRLSADYNRPSNILLIHRMNLPKILEYYNLYNVNVKELDIIIDNLYALENYQLIVKLETLRSGYIRS